ncbi:DNA-methyltransferase [Mucilaginibacter sp. E4BP6]|uniref:DNA-methyltransferase n=1 Tax=Mucilaginibacter sp. E4BP6 TaxID=2723089 RepID=UPI0015C6C02E|nr:site-specific DNA-methyltransferase [Mucilaginibacter sp. E4BP6]NYE65129.1 site-specific DNA-methyltransferase (cytosine-N4-specific) [Mucilaginibacter sp. E4BP6]
MDIAYKTENGIFFHGDTTDLTIEDVKKLSDDLVSLIFTSPPFPLKRKKKYGNKNGQEYIDWLVGVVRYHMQFLKEDGSLVIEVGNAWEPGLPEMSTLPLEALLAIKNQCNLHLCQSFVWYNTAKLPGPAEWVNVKRIRVKDSFTHIWWLSKTPNPKADNRKVLKEYSSSMKKLLKDQKYNAGTRPSEHVINETSFLKEHGGAIPSNVLMAANTGWAVNYQNFCKLHDLTLHPARMPREIPEFFIKMLTEEGDIIFDPFGGSNTTGKVADELNRKWITTELNIEYIKGSEGRFTEIQYGAIVSD